MESAASKPNLISNLIQTILKGTFSVLSLKETLKFLNKTKRIQTVSSLLLLNGFIFGGSLALWEWAILPFLEKFVEWIFLSNENIEVEGGISNAKASAVQFVTLLWLAPMLVLSVLLNMIWYGEIAEDAFEREDKKIKRAASKSVRDEVYRVFLFFVLTAQSWISLNLLPSYIGIPIEFVQSSWTIAFYCYDYGWALAGDSLEERLAKFEAHWPFMLGFGAPLAFLALSLPIFWGYVAYGLFFPVCMIRAIQTVPEEHVRGWSTVRVFRFSQFVTLWLIRLVFKKRD